MIQDQARKRIDFLNNWLGRKTVEISIIMDHGFSEDQAIELLKVLSLDAIEETLAHK